MNDGLILALYPQTSLAKNARVPVSPPSPTELSIGQNVSSRAEVDKVMKGARRRGRRSAILRENDFWGGYSGYFEDLDGHLWEIAWNPKLEVRE